MGGILDYAAEAKDGELPETVKPIDEEDGRFLCSARLVATQMDIFGIFTYDTLGIPTPLTPNFKGGPPKCNVHFFLGGREG